ncbi:aspartic proteinase 36-like isoform X1 [Phragmites australis]|uniref:aspartic proteinase 36-like isoform X1 n=1 Tax=Phragmites australis TaxID=29695 RepID=UPI002D79BB21|nr:aspartic proteinase 36-like isoform X1 [Phragmites australis]
MAPRAALLLAAALLAAAAAASSAFRAEATGVFQVRRKFPAGGGGSGGNVSALRAHDSNRHGRLLAAVDLPLGGLGLPNDAGYVAVSWPSASAPGRSGFTFGADLVWDGVARARAQAVLHGDQDRDAAQTVLRAGGHRQRHPLGQLHLLRPMPPQERPRDLTLYDPKGSSSGSMVSCDQGFCVSTYGGKLPGCTTSIPCEYSVMYGDGSSTTGYFVTDALEYDQVSGDGQTRSANASVTFGCGAQQGGDLGSSNQALDGILGFGQSNTSMLSQLAAAGKVKKIFAHCLDTINGGGIFAIGNVVQPKVKTTPLVPNMPHYNVNLKSIDVGDTTLQLPAHVFETGRKKGTIIDSGTTLTYLPELVFKDIMLVVFNKHQDITFHNVQDFLCFQYSGSVDDAFPTITFHFEDDLPLHVYPHEYFFQNGNDLYCVGFQNGGLQSKDGKDMVLLGDLVLSNKLVVYDLENQVIGWTDYNCSSSIKIMDDKTGAIYTVDAHDISFGWRFHWHKSLILLLVTMVCCYLIR